MFEKKMLTMKYDADSLKKQTPPPPKKKPHVILTMKPGCLFVRKLSSVPVPSEGKVERVSEKRWAEKPAHLPGTAGGGLSPSTKK